MKKFAYILMIIFSVSLIFAGCAKNDDDNVDPVYNMVPYVVYHYFEDAVGNSYTTYEKEEFTGRLNSTVTITEKTVQYYNYNKSSSYYSGTITSTTTVFSLYYKRQQFTIQFVDPKTVNEQKTARFGSSITLPTRTKEGFTFLGWAYDVEGINLCELTTMPTQNLILYAVWEQQ